MQTKRANNKNMMATAEMRSVVAEVRFAAMPAIIVADDKNIFNTENGEARSAVFG